MVGRKEELQRAAVVAREVELARGLAGNSAPERARQLRRLNKWLRYRSASRFDFSEHDLMRIWKGLFYSVWMSDKPLVQENLCEDIAKLFECFGDENIATSILFYKCGLKTLGQDWFGIDQHRLDKFMMFARRITRGVLRCVKRRNWNKEATDLLEDCLSGEGGIFSVSFPPVAPLALGLKLHLIDCWMEELAKLNEGDMDSDAVIRLIKPFVLYLSQGKETRLIEAISKNIFFHLIKQTDIGIEYQEKLMAWKRAGYPGHGVEAMEKVENDESSEDNETDEEEIDEDSNEPKVLDPRAGHVDVELSQLPVDSESIVEMLKVHIPDPKTANVNRNKLQLLIANFEKLNEGDYPFKLTDLMMPSDPKLRMPKVKNAAVDLMNFEDGLLDGIDAERLKGLNKKQRKRLLAKLKKKMLRSKTAVSESPEKPSKSKKESLKVSSRLERIPKRRESLKNCFEFTVTDNSPKKPANLDSNGFTQTGFKVTEEKLTKVAADEQNETEIIVPLKKTPKATVKSNRIANGAVAKLNGNALKTLSMMKNNSTKKININLNKNTSHSIVDYVRSVESSPDIPFDSRKRPMKTSLKPNAMPSPINPFYKKKIGFNL